MGAILPAPQHRERLLSRTAQCPPPPDTASLALVALDQLAIGVDLPAKRRLATGIFAGGLLASFGLGSGPAASAALSQAPDGGFTT
jgi:hypothetical protein